MKTIVYLAIGLISSLVWAQDEVLFNKEIKTLRVSAGIEVTLITETEENKIQGKERVLETINYKLSKGELKLSLPLGSLFEKDFPLQIKVYANAIEHLNMVRGSSIEIQNTITSSRFSIRATEGSVVSGDFDTQSLELKAISGALIDIRGKTENLDVLVNTGGEFKGRHLQTKNTKVKVTYGGIAVVHATENCEANVVAGGTIDIHGNPKYMNEKTTIGGNINLLKN